MLADGMSSGRLIGLSIGTLAATCAAVIVVHDLWQRSRDPLSREQIVLANIGTLLTVLLGVITLYLVLFAICAVCGGALIPEHVLASEIGHGVGVGDYVKLAWFGSTFATLGGALGSVVESDLSVREAMYGK
jgi:hypothetical protein